MMDRPSPLPGISERAPEPHLGLHAGDQLILRGPRMDFVLRPTRTTSGQTQLREVVVHPGAVLILPLLDDGRIVMIKNQRHTVHEELWELPAGTLHVGEAPALCAARELTEETGYTAGRLESLGWFYTSPGVLTEKMFTFAGLDLKEGKQSLEDNEQIRVERLTRGEILDLIQENKIVDAKSIATLLKYFQTH